MDPNKTDDERAKQQKKMELQLKQWGTQLGVLRARAGKAGAAAGTELRQQVDDLIALQRSAKKHLDEFLGASAERWKESKAGLVDGWAKLSTAVETTWRRNASDRS
jgi:hypothetical protein